MFVKDIEDVRSSKEYYRLSLQKMVLCFRLKEIVINLVNPPPFTGQNPQNSVSQPSQSNKLILVWRPFCFLPLRERCIEKKVKKN